MVDKRLFDFVVIILPWMESCINGSVGLFAVKVVGYIDGDCLCHQWIKGFTLNKGESGWQPGYNCLSKRGNGNGV
jgi:hypothetical protein